MAYSGSRNTSVSKRGEFLKCKWYKRANTYNINELKTNNIPDGTFTAKEESEINLEQFVTSDILDYSKENFIISTKCQIPELCRNNVITINNCELWRVVTTKRVLLRIRKQFSKSKMYKTIIVLER